MSNALLHSCGLEGHPADEILKAANDTDLVVMGSLGQIPSRKRNRKSGPKLENASDWTAPLILEKSGWKNIQISTRIIDGDKTATFVSADSPTLKGNSIYWVTYRINNNAIVDNEQRHRRLIEHNSCNLGLRSRRQRELKEQAKGSSLPEQPARRLAGPAARWISQDGQRANGPVEAVLLLLSSTDYPGRGLHQNDSRGDLLGRITQSLFL